MKTLFFLLFTLSLYSSNFDIVGTVISDNQKMVGAKYMGYVKHIYFDIGDKVKKEDTLFELESAEFDIIKEQGDIAIEQGEAIVDMYKTRLDGIEKERKLLRKKGYKKSKEYENLSTTAEALSSSLKAMKEMSRTTTKRLKNLSRITDYIEVKAQNDGIIVQKQIRKGDFIAPGMLTMVLVDLSNLEVEAEVAESNLHFITIGREVDISIPSLNILTKGSIKSIVPNSNPMAHTFAIRVKFKKVTDGIYPGMYAKVNIGIDK
jgi:multidrug resistance efflux pump